MARRRSPCRSAITVVIAIMLSCSPDARGKTILVLDDDEDLREILQHALHDVCDAECIGASDVPSLIELGGRVNDCSLAILDVNLGPGQPSGVVAHAWLVEHGFPGRIVFLTGHAMNHPLVQAALHTGTAQVLQKPVSLSAIISLVDGQESDR